ncbi:MAG: PTS fructose transporter subunit IIC [Romboutsia sp.]|uniref:PTS fructose transporter subunit IIC n=1 Tax=Romboutsia sp. TaxID=1965302 RepID=UPI003F381A36
MAVKKKVISSTGATPTQQTASNNTNQQSSDKKVSKKSSMWKEINKHLMTGISHMIPVLLMGGLLGAIAEIIPNAIVGLKPGTDLLEAMNSGLYSGMDLQLLNLAKLMGNFGFTLFGFAIPLFAAFCANSIGGKTALITGFIGGYVAVKPVGMPQLVDGQWTEVVPVASGFLGAIIIAFAIGYFVKWLNKVIKVSHNWLAFKTTFLVPLIAAATTMVLMLFVITPIGGMVNEAMKTFLTSAGEAGEFGYAAALAAATAFDLGGPVNKAAGFVALGLATDDVLPLTARCIAIVIPSIGLGLTTLIDQKLVGRKVYDRQFYQAGKTSMFLSFMGISEGAIPFALERPGFVIPLNIAGAIVGALTGVGLGAVQWFPESAIWAWPLVENLPAYIGGIAAGAIFIAVVNTLYRNKLIKDGKLTVNG